MTSTYENRPVYNERRLHTHEELKALRPGTIFIFHGGNTSVLMKVDNERAQYLAEETPVYTELRWLTGSDTTFLAVNTDFLVKYTGKDKIRIFLNKNLNWSKGKRAAHAVHTALIALGVHPGFAVTVLESSPTNIRKMDVQTEDSGQTELAPGTLTGGTDFLKDEEAL